MIADDSRARTDLTPVRQTGIGSVRRGPTRALRADGRPIEEQLALACVLRE